VEEKQEAEGRLAISGCHPSKMFKLPERPRIKNNEQAEALPLYGCAVSSRFKNVIRSKAQYRSGI